MVYYCGKHVYIMLLFLTQVYQETLNRRLETVPMSTSVVGLYSAFRAARTVR